MMYEVSLHFVHGLYKAAEVVVEVAVVLVVVEIVVVAMTRI